MSSQLFVQPSTLALNAAALISAGGVWQRGIPTPGATGIPAVGGIPDCKNLLAASPPTLLEQYDLYSYAIGWAVEADMAGAGDVSVELALLVNDRVAFVETQEQTTVVNGAENFASGAFVTDLVNPLQLGARDRLSLRLGVMFSAKLSAAGTAVLGIQLDNNGNPSPYESTLSYYVTRVPPARQMA